MLRLKPRQWTFLADKVADVANLVAGALVVGFFLGEGRTPGRLLVAGLAIWGVLVIIALVVSAEEPMTDAIIFFAGIALIVGVIVFLDWLARRKDAQSHR